VKLVVVIIAGLGSFEPAAAAAQQSSTGSSVEDIYVVRSLRLSRSGPSDYCAERRTGFPAATFEDQYDFKAVTARPTDGRVTGAAGPTVGHLHTCCGVTSILRTYRLVSWAAN
jgi:hypothetical protein